MATYEQPNVPDQVNMFTAFKKYADFNGRARRSEFWWWQLLLFIVNVVLSILQQILVLPFQLASDGDDACAIIVAIISILLFIINIVWGLAVFVPGLAVQVRRLHDTGRSGWNVLWGLLPCVGWVLLLIWFCQDSHPGPNQYGLNPKGIGNDVCDCSENCND